MRKSAKTDTEAGRLVSTVEDIVEAYGKEENEENQQETDKPDEEKNANDQQDEAIKVDEETEIKISSEIKVEMFLMFRGSSYALL